MRVIKHMTNQVTSEEPVVVYLFGDTHFGNPNMKLDLLKKHVDMCKRENAYWVHVGDWCEFISPNDRRFDINNPPPDIQDQMWEAVDTFSPIADQCMAVLSGNHEYVIGRYYGDPMKTILNGLDRPEYLGFSGFINLRLPLSSTTQKAYDIFMHHGHGMGALLGAKAINLHRLSHKFRANIYVIGHIHTWQHQIDEIVAIKTSGLRRPILKKEKRWYISVPSYFDPYVESEKANYAELAAVYPQPNGCGRMEIGRRNGDWYFKLEPLFG